MIIIFSCIRFGTKILLQSTFFRFCEQVLRLHLLRAFTHLLKPYIALIIITHHSEHLKLVALKRILQWAFNWIQQLIMIMFYWNLMRNIRTNWMQRETFKIHKQTFRDKMKLYFASERNPIRSFLALRPTRLNKDRFGFKIYFVLVNCFNCVWN